MNPNSLEYARYLIDQLFPTPLVVFILVIPLAIAIGLRLAGYIINQIQKMVMAMPSESTDKPKRQPVSFFEAPTEPDEVVGFGDDGELVYASEKPKRKNDEVGG